MRRALSHAWLWSQLLWVQLPIFRSSIVSLSFPSDVCQCPTFTFLAMHASVTLSRTCQQFCTLSPRPLSKFFISLSSLLSFVFCLVLSPPFAFGFLFCYSFLRRGLAKCLALVAASYFLLSLLSLVFCFAVLELESGAETLVAFPESAFDGEEENAEATPSEWPICCPDLCPCSFFCFFFLASCSPRFLWHWVAAFRVAHMLPRSVSLFLFCFFFLASCSPRFLWH
jgi:hypothetical protein